MNSKINPKILFVLEVLLTAAFFVLLSVPAFNMTGLILKPLLLCVIGGILISTLLTFIPRGEAVCGYSLLLFVCFWAVFTLIKQLRLQIMNGFPGKWIYFFYFDKLLMVGTIWLAVVSFFVIKRISKKQFTTDYKIFLRMSSVAFVIFYSFLLVYSFVLIRLERGEYPLNWVPFTTIKEYISDFSSIPYEVFMMFFGNLFYFAPLGIIFYLLLKKHNSVVRLLVSVLFPPIAFSLLEYSQFLLQNGFCEFDDMMMNSLGFWFGALFAYLLDKTVRKLTKGIVTGFWC